MRLRDPLNLQQMLEIERRFPHIKLVIAHIGRAYCPQDIGDAFEVLQESQRMSFDFSANTNAVVIEGALRAFGAQRLLFGSDLPIVRMRMRRICEDGVYINIVPHGTVWRCLRRPAHARREPGRRRADFLLFVRDAAGFPPGCRSMQLERRRGRGCPV